MANIPKLHIPCICIPRLEAMFTIGSNRRSQGQPLDPSTAVLWCFDDGSTIALDDRTQIATAPDAPQ